METMKSPINRQIVIDSKKTKQFVKEFNKNIVTDEFVASCKKAETLFKKQE